MTAPRSAVGSQARAVAIICMLVSGASGAASVSAAIGLSDRGIRSAESLPRGTPTADLFAKLAEAHARASQPDRHARAALLVVLAISMFFTFVSAGRVLRPAGLPREGIRRLLCGAALVSAILRTVDGAADAAFALRFARLATQVLPPGQRVPSDSGLAPTLTLGTSVLQTVLVAGALAIVAQYFRSARVKAWAALQDEAPR
ncbi:MAG TPA: hypothetical protein VFN45_09340 [Myxococcaceae bacterium]|nr:hypothetical protein [Myxococcaceae bacterium]